MDVVAEKRTMFHICKEDKDTGVEVARASNCIPIIDEGCRSLIKKNDIGFKVKNN